MTKSDFQRSLEQFFEKKNPKKVKTVPSFVKAYVLCLAIIMCFLACLFCFQRAALAARNMPLRMFVTW